MCALYARHNARIYRFVLRLTNDEGLSEEVVNEVFLEVRKSADKFGRRSSGIDLATRRSSLQDASGAAPQSRRPNP
jgi:DNA-directed RNA polymerase specialized sigma24 family protein